MEIVIKLFVMILLMVSFITTPMFSKKGIHFGVRAPNIDTIELKKIQKGYIIWNIILGIIATYIMIMVEDPVVGILATTFGYMALFSLVYIRAYKAVKDLKTTENIHPHKHHVTVVDTNFTKEREKNMRVSPWYFLIPLCISLIIAVISLVYYDRIPNPMPMHYNASGVVDGWAEKTYGTVLMLPMVSLAMTGVFYWIYIIIGKSKQQINAKNPRVSSKQNRKFRKIWSGYAVGSAILMNMLFGYMQLNLFRSPVEKAGEMMFITLGFTIVLIISTFVIAFYAGNGGSKLKVEGELGEERPEEESDDDQYWKWGSIYYNPNDPSVFVEKRVGIGWTVNMGTLQGKLYIVGTLIFTIAVIVISIMNS